MEAEVSYSLTKREKEVLILAAKGYSNKHIAGKLYISMNTVKGHMSSIMKKLHMRNRQQITAWMLGVDFTTTSPPLNI